MVEASDTNSNDGKGAERRRYARLPINLEATLLVAGRSRVACVGKDFCVAGMFVQLESAELAQIKPQDTAELFFHMPGIPNELSLALVICRVIPSGLGVAFHNPPASTLQLLENSVLSTTRDSLNDLSETQRRFAPAFGRTLPKMLDIAERFAGFVSEEFLRQVAESLFMATREAKSNVEARQVMDAQMKIREGGDAVRRRVPELLGQAMAVLGNPIASDHGATGLDTDTRLSLIDKQEFEQFLSISAVVAELEKGFADPLAELSSRLSGLGQRVIEKSGNPAGPAVLCNIFAEVLKQHLTSALISETAFRTLRRVLEANLARLYDDLNAMLEEHDIKPMLELLKPNIPLRSPPAPGRSRAGERQASPLTNPAADLAASYGGIGHPMAPPAAFMGGHPEAGGMPLAPGQWNAPYEPVAGFPPLGFGDFSATMDQPGVLATELASASWAGAAPFHVPVQRALGTARAQLGLRRQLRQPDAATANTPAAVYPVAQLAEALEELARTFTKPGESAALLDADAIGQQVIGALGKRGVAPAAIAPEQQEIIEVMVNVLGALLQDPRIADIAKANISRLQAVAHKAAVLDEQFFNDDKHPVRQLLDRVAEVRPATSALQEEQLEQKVSAIIRTAEQKLDGDPAQLAPVLDELNALLEAQSQDYQDNVSAVVQTSVEQQKVLKEHREKAGVAANSPVSRQSQSPEWERWLRRARALAEGDRFLMNANTRQSYAIALVWLGEDFNPFVFVDRRGLKALTLTLEQVAMNLRRGVLKPLLGNATPAVERALSGVVEQFHEEIAEQAEHDELTGLLTRKGFWAAIEKRLTLAAQTGAPPVLAQLALTNLKALNDEHGDDTGNEVLRTVARYLSERYGKKSVLVGRVGGGAFGLYWDKAIVWTASEEMDQVIKELVALARDHDGRAVTLSFAAGLVEVGQFGARAEQLWETVAEACAEGEANPDKPVVVAGAENRHQEQLKQITSYVQKAVQRERLVLLFQEARAVRSERPPLMQMAVSAADRKGKLIPPALFAQAAASSALAWDVDLWLVRETLRWMQAATTDSERFATVVLPLSGASLVREGLASVILELLMETAVPPARLCFALIDRDAVAHLAETAELVNTLREFGCRFMLDEFGGGQGDYAHVRELAVDYVCLQRAVIDEARRNPKDYAMAKSVNELAHFMGKLTLARQTASDPLDQWAKELGIDLILDQTRMTRLKTDKK